MERQEYPIFRHQLTGVITNSPGHGPEQTKLIRRLNRMPRSWLIISSERSVICETCPLNSDSTFYDSSVEGDCDRDDLNLRIADERL